MKILMFGWKFTPSSSGGLGTACSGLVKGLLGKGVEILFVMPGERSDMKQPGLRIVNEAVLPESTRQEGLGNVTLSIRMVGALLSPYMTGGIYRDVYRSSIGDGMKSAPAGPCGSDIYGEVLRYADMARGVAREEAFDTIHAHDWMSIPAGIAAKDQRGVPLVIHIHSLESDRSPVRIDERIYGIERFGMIAADHVIAVSSYTKKKIIDQYGISPEKISVVHNAAFSIECAPDVANKKTGAQVLFLGRLSEQKGPGKFMEAARKVNALDPDVRFVIAGEGELAEKLKEEAEFFEMEKYLRFTGFVSGPEVCRLYAASDLYVMPSISEPFGITALEAVLCGTPVILSCHSGVTEVLARAPRIDPQDTAGLAVRILEVIHDSEKKSRIVSECREDMRGIGWGKTAEDIMGIYKRVEAKGAL